MDLKLLDSKKEEAVRLDLRHPATGEVLTYGKDDAKIMHLMLLGRDSETYRKFQRKLLDKRLKEQQRNRNNMKMTAAQLEEESADLLACVTVGGAVFLDGKEIPVHTGNAADLYRSYPFIKESADQFVEDRSNYIQD